MHGEVWNRIQGFLSPRFLKDKTMIVILYSSQKHFKCMIGWYRQHLLLAFYFKEYFCNLLILCLKRPFHILKAYFLLYGNYCLSNQRINTQLNKFKLAKCFPGALIKKCVGSLKFSFLYKAATSWVKSLSPAKM